MKPSGPFVILFDPQESEIQESLREPLVSQGNLSDSFPAPPYSQLGCCCLTVPPPQLSQGPQLGEGGPLGPQRLLEAPNAFSCPGSVGPGP